MSANEVVCDKRDEQVWLEARRTGIGASEIGPVLGLSPWSGPLEVYADKVVPVDRAASPAMERGSALEPVVLAMAAQELGETLVEDEFLRRSTEHRHLLATVDGRIGTVDGIVFEGKTSLEGHGWEDGVPAYYRAQVQQQLHVTGQDAAVLGCLNIRAWRLDLYDITRDQAFIDDVLLPQAHEFWHGHVLPRVEPVEFGGGASAKQAWNRLHPDDNGEAALVGEDGVEIIQKWLAAKDLKKEAEERVDALHQAVKELFGDRSYLFSEDGRWWSCRTTRVAEKMMPAKLRKGYSYRVVRELSNPPKGVEVSA